MILANEFKRTRGSNEIWDLWLNLYQDINTNEVMEHFEPHEQILVNVTNHTMTFNSVLSTNEVDLDGDLIPDWWEALNGMSYTNKADRFTDFDGDWIENKWEYDLGLDPHSYDTNNYAFADAMRAVDSRIAGKEPTNAIEIFSTQNHSAGIYERNTNCWAADIDLTSCSPWNSYTGVKRAGTLISPRHVLFAAHYDHVGIGDTLRFVDADNDVVERTLQGKKRHPDYSSDDRYPDLTVGLLNADVPTNTVTWAAVLPGDYEDYIGTGGGIPTLCLDQEEKALIADTTGVSIESGDSMITDFSYPLHAERAGYSEELIIGDSGNPAFLLLNDKPVLLTVWTYGGPGRGTSATWFKADIDGMMADLEQENGLTNGYQLSEADLSSYDRLDD